VLDVVNYLRFYLFKQAGTVVYINGTLTHDRQLRRYIVIVYFDTECFKKTVYSLAYILS